MTWYCRNRLVLALDYLDSGSGIDPGNLDSDILDYRIDLDLGLESCIDLVHTPVLVLDLEYHIPPVHRNTDSVLDSGTNLDLDLLLNHQAYPQAPHLPISSLYLSYIYL